MKDGYIDFDEYIRQGEPDKQEKATLWRTAIGLQDVDGLKVSDYLKETAVRHIEGDITIDDVREQLKSYYVNKTTHDEDDAEKEEADRVAANIAKLLNEQSFSFTALEFLNIHRHLFEGVFKHAGKLRPYDISKKEWVLRGDSVVYGRAADIMMALRYDIQQEKDFNYKGLSTDEIISHIVDFVTLLWQNHPFREGNTRTTAVFVIKYLRSIGFKVDNDLFADNSWYFRNALVRANYKNAIKGIDYTSVYLERFFRNLLLGEKWDLRNRYLHIHATDEWKVQQNLAGRTVDQQEEYKHRASTGQVQDKLSTDNANIKRLIIVIGNQELSVKSMMDALELKGRDNFQNLYLKPAISEGYVCLLYPNSPRHPRQKYLLTVKGLTVYKHCNKSK